MSIAKVKFIDLTANISKLDDFLVKFIDLKGFHPILASEIVEKVHGLTSFVSDNPCQPLLAEVEDLQTKYGFKLLNLEQRDQVYTFNEMYDYMHKTKEEFETESNTIKQLEEHIQKYNDALIQVQNIQNLDIALDDLFACEYIGIRFGRLPNDSVDKLRFFQNKPFVFKSFNHDHNNSWCMYFTTAEYKREVDNIFSSLFFERIFIPDFVHGTPKDAVEALQDEIENTQKMIDKYKDDLEELTKSSCTQLIAMKGELLYLNRIYEAKKYVVGLGNKFSISGFVEENNVDCLKESFEDFKDLEIEVNDAYSDRRIKPPTKLKNGWISKPIAPKRIFLYLKSKNPKSIRTNP